MKKRWQSFVFIFLAIILLSFYTSALENEAFSPNMNKFLNEITYQAEQYESGNINYIQLVLYASSARQKLNELLGVASQNEGGLLKQEQIKAVLGEPTENTKWVWIEGEEREQKTEKPLPAWRKTIFDGKKIQITLDAWPSIYKTGKERVDEKELWGFENLAGGRLVYRLHYNIQFKRPEEQFNVESKIEDIKTLAEKFNTDPSNENAETLAKESVNVEKAFQTYFQQSGQKCEDYMKTLFGSENLRETMTVTSYKVDFYESENVQAIINLEMCEDCNWNWINLNMYLDGRGRFRHEKAASENNEEISREQYRNLDFNSYESETRALLENIKSDLEAKNYESALRKSQKLQAINDAWNEKSNNVYDEVNKEFESKVNNMDEKTRNEYYQDYGWLKDEKEKRGKMNNIKSSNFDKRKEFYMNLFSNYDKTEESYQQIDFQKRLVENIREFGEEICNNNKDDNKNNQVDCEDEQCGGKICGETIETISNGNETIEKKTQLYCIKKECVAKEEIINESIPICGNNICEEGEAGIVGNSTNNSIGSCQQDCAQCKEYAPVACNGKVIFSGEDVNGCPLEPVCLEEDSCRANEDCNFLCGVGECKIESNETVGKCVLSELTRCENQTCMSGERSVSRCVSGEEIIREICEDGMWKETGVVCEEGNVSEGEIGEIAVGNECSVRSDCGGNNDVCSNGHCVTLPETSEEELEEQPTSGESEIEEERTNEQIESEESDNRESGEETREEFRQDNEENRETENVENSVLEATGNVIFNFIRAIPARITGYITEEGESEEESESSDSGQESSGDLGNGEDNENSESNDNEDSPENTGNEDDNGPNQENIPIHGLDQRENENNEQERRNREEEREVREQEEKERRTRECKERCDRECYDMNVRPCAEKCIREKCGEEFECDVDETRKNCEEGCKTGEILGTCTSDCNEKCMKGENTWKEPEREKQMEEVGVFTAGGNCRTTVEKKEGYLWFGGWGEPFDRIQNKKQKYYSGGDSDWCRLDLENLKRQRKEMENSFNEEFVKWFFEKHLANSAEDWETSMGGIFEVYWKNVDISREMANRMQCLGLKELPEHDLTKIKYESEYGSLEYWEEIKTTEIQKGEGEVNLITPYMKLWIFPPKEFIKAQMKKSMKNHQLPGPEGKSESTGLTEEEKRELRNDKDFMNWAGDLSDEYGGEMEASLQFKDLEKNEVIFNVYVKVSEKDLIYVEPMPLEEMPQVDITAVLDFEDLYDIISVEEKDMQSIHIESPPWARTEFSPVNKIKEVKNGAVMYLKFRNMINNAKVTPKDSKGDVKRIFGFVFDRGGEDRRQMVDEEKGEGEFEEKITGMIVRK